MHLAQLVFGQLQAHAGQVDRLAAGHAVRASGTRQQAAQPGLHGCGNIGFIVGRSQRVV
ncbi:hypothetical protein D3C81_2084140 [compost metagenome]